MKKLMYLGLCLAAVLVSSESCLKNETIQGDEILERRIIYSTDTIVILDPEIGNEIKKVIEKRDTVWIHKDDE